MPSPPPAAQAPSKEARALPPSPPPAAPTPSKSWIAVPPSPLPGPPAASKTNFSRPPSHPQAAFTLLEVMMALLLLATSITILVQSQATAIHLQDEAIRINTATMLARSVFVDLDLRIAQEGFGELEVKENGDFSDQQYDGQFDDYRWEYEVEKVEVELPNLSNLMGMMGEGTEEVAATQGISTGGQAPANDLASLGALGFDMSFLSEQLGNYLREARVRICWTPGKGGPRPSVEEECIEVVSHLANPTGKVLSAEEQDQLNALEDAQGLDAAEQALDNLNRPSR